MTERRNIARGDKTNSINGGKTCCTELHSHRFPVFHVPDFIKILPPVAPILGCSPVPVPAKQLDVQVLDHEGLDVRIAFGGYRVAAERKDRRGEDPGLGLVDVHVVNERQVPDAAGDGHVKVVFHTAGQGTVPHPQVTVALVGVEWDKNDLGPLLGRDPGQLGKLDVVADHDLNAAADPRSVRNPSPQCSGGKLAERETTQYSHGK